MSVRSEREGAVVTLTLDNLPGQYQDLRLNSELDDTLRELERDRSVRAIVITGAHPRSFVTHYDVAEMRAMTRRQPDMPLAAVAAQLRLAGLVARFRAGRRLLDGRLTRGLLGLARTHQLYLRMNRMDKPIVAAINGSAAGGGCELALACDIRVMADGDFTIGLTEPTLGFNPGGGGGQRLARALGASRAIEMLLEARHLSPREAHELGLVHYVVAADELLDAAREVAQRLARRAPRAVWACKRAVYRGQSSRWPAGYRLDSEGFAWGVLAPETQRALEVFLEQLAQAPEGVPSPWHDPEMLRAWQEGRVASFGG